MEIFRLFCELGNYDEYLEAKQKELEKQSSQQESLKRQIETEREFLSRRAKDSQAKGKARKRRVQELEEQANRQLRDNRTDSITIPVPTTRLGNDCIAFDGLTKSYGNVTLMNNLSGIIPPGSIVALLGSNGPQ